MKKILYAILIPLCLAGCIDTMPSPLDNQTDSNIIGVTITLSSDIDEVRTLFPAAAFERYELNFTGSGGTLPVVNMSKTDKSITVALTDGTWTVIAYGFVLIGGVETRVAQGYGQINVVFGQNQTLNIHLGVYQSGTGTFTYNITIPNNPHGKPIAPSALEITGLSSGTSPSTSVPLSSLTTTGSMTLNAGYYRMQIQLDNGYIVVSKTEIVQIYPGLVTNMGAAFNEGDFTNYFTIGGYVNVTVNGGVPANPVYINVYSGNNYSPIGRCTVSGNSWSLPLAYSTANTPLYFRVETFVPLNGGTNGNTASREVRPGGVTMNVNNSSINLGTVAFNTITLSGSADVIVNGARSTNARVYITGFYSDSALIDSSGNWSREILAFDNPMRLQFIVHNTFTVSMSQTVSGYYGSTLFRDVHNSSVGGINFGTINISIPVVTLSGTVTVNSAIPFTPYVYIYRDSNYSLPSRSIPIMTLNASSTWSETLLVSDVGTNPYFAVAYSHPVTGIWTVHRTGVNRTIPDSGGTVSGIDLGVINIP